MSVTSELRNNLLVTVYVWPDGTYFTAETFSLFPGLMPVGKPVTRKITLQQLFNNEITCP